MSLEGGKAPVYDLAEAIRERILEAFADVPMPSLEDVFDTSDPDDPEGEQENYLSDTRFYREALGGRHWTEVPHHNIRGIFMGTLNPPGYRYYIQSIIATEVEGDPLGVYPEDVYLIGSYADSLYEELDASDLGRPWVPYYDHQYFEAVFNSKQLDAIATYVWLYARNGCSLANHAFERFWKKYVLPHGILDRIEREGGLGLFGRSTS